jgi:MFS family permease
MMTLTITSVFAIASAFAPNLWVICLLLMLMGFGVGGNLPVDGALFLEFVPAEKQSLLTLMSVFWPIGQFLTSLISLLVIPRPGMSCPIHSDCPWETNTGWRIIQFTLGMFTVLMVIGRVLLFSLFESPKFLISKGRYEEAVDVLQQLAALNGKRLDVKVSDFTDFPQTQILKDSKISGWQTNVNRVKSLFKKEFLVTTMLVWLIWIFVALGNNMFFG